MTMHTTNSQTVIIFIYCTGCMEHICTVASVIWHCIFWTELQNVTISISILSLFKFFFKIKTWNWWHFKCLCFNSSNMALFPEYVGLFCRGMAEEVCLSLNPVGCQ